MQQQKPSSPTNVSPVTRKEMRPVKYHYADSFWCTYIISVVSANIAEMGKLLGGSSWPLHVRRIFNMCVCSHISARFDKNSSTNPRRGKCSCNQCRRIEVKGNIHSIYAQLPLVMANRSVHFSFRYSTGAWWRPPLALCVKRAHSNYGKE